MLYKLFLLIAPLFLSFLFCTSTQAAVIWHEDMEAGPTTWETTGFWHLQNNPQNQHIQSYLYNNVVQLPDAGYLPTAKSGSNVWWYGETATGSFIGNPYPTPQNVWSGGTSYNLNTGNLITPTIDLSGQSKATLSFWTWWEIEGVDSDLYDMMYVDVWTEGSGWENLDNINPAEDVDAPPYKPYSSGGVGQVGTWINPKFDLSNYADQNIKIRFRFNTIDTLYNAFRGWLIDDVKITNNQILPSFKKANITASQTCSGFSSVAINKPANFSVKNGQKVKITANQNYSISKYGNYSWVCSNKKKCYLPPGNYTIWANFNAHESCPQASQSIATVKFNKSNPWPRVGPSGSVASIFGSKFTNGIKIFLKGDTLNETNVNVISSNEAIIKIPALSDGIYDVIIKDQNNQVKRTLKNAYQINNKTKLDITGIFPLEINNDITNSITVTGTGLTKKTKVTIAGLPLKKRKFNKSAGTITGILPKGASPGYQNVQVSKKGQINTEVGALKVNSAAETLYNGKKGKNLSKPNRLKKIRVTKIAPGTFKFTWKKRTRTNNYRYRILLNGEILEKNKLKHPKHSKTLEPEFISPYAGQELKFQARSQNKYGYTKWRSILFIAS